MRRVNFVKAMLKAKQQQLNRGESNDSTYSTTNVLELGYLFAWKKSYGAHLVNAGLVVTGILDCVSSIAVRRLEQNSGITLISWLQRNTERFGTLFSILWFVDAFVWANRRRLQAVQNLEPSKPTSENEDDTTAVAWRKCQGVYVRTMALQFLLLPVGFVEVVLKFLLRWIAETDGSVPLWPEQTQTTSQQQQQRAGISVGFAILLSCWNRLIRALGSQWESFRMTRVRRWIRILIIFGVKHPFRFRRRYQRSLRALRWIKHLAPIIGALNKLRGNCGDLVKRFRQYKRTRHAKNLRILRRRKLSKAELQKYCSILIQKSYRSYMARKKIYLLNVLSAKREVVAALRLQTQLRAWMLRSKARLRHDWRELKRLHALPRLQMSADERRRMYHLQTELRKETDYLLNKKLLLRPNTPFSVVWKLIFLVSVVFEITILAYKPYLVQQHKGGGDSLETSMEKILLHKFIPEPLATSSVCNPPVKTKGNVVTRLFRINKRKKEQPQHLPWYCNATVTSVQGILVEAAKLLVHHIPDMFWCISFLDVFVVFFTGSYNSQTGELEPAPFIIRWIVPGLCFQLLVNDKVERAYGFARRLLEGLLHHGPSRVLRWTIALFFPLSLRLRDSFRHALYKYVTEQNRRLQEKKLLEESRRRHDILLFGSSRRHNNVWDHR